MAHFAKLDENNIVTEVIVVNNDVITVDGVESEQAGIDFLTGLYGHSNWKQTSYNTENNEHVLGGNPLRGNYARIGYKYHPDFDIFIAQNEFPSWKINYNLAAWEAPKPVPDYIPGYFWNWSEINQEWISLKAL
jgi:hypothetical protein